MTSSNTAPVTAPVTALGKPPGTSSVPGPSPRLSFEFFPPKTDAMRATLAEALDAFAPFGADFVSMTWGALGAESDASLDGLALLGDAGSPPRAAHLTCTGRRPAHVHAMLDAIEALGVKHVVALRGDRPTGLGRVARSRKDAGGEGAGTPLRYATDLVALLAERGGFEISVSAYPETHPEATGTDHDIDVLKRKFELGATRALTQFFFEPDTFLRFRDRAAARGVTGHIVPGILPIRDIDKAVEFAGRCGADVPRALQERFRAATDDAARERLAVEQATGLCEALVAEGVDELHFYTLNRADPTREIVANLAGTVRDRTTGVHAAA